MRDRVPRARESGGQHAVDELQPVALERRQQPLSTPGRRGRARRRLVDRALEHHRVVVERVGERRVGLDPAQAVLLERQRRSAGDPMPSGWIAEHTSWRNPGSVSSAVREPRRASAAPRARAPGARRGRA